MEKQNKLLKREAYRNTEERKSREADMDITGGDAVIIYEIYRQRRQYDRRKERAGQPA